jgi:hypothetical protein
MSDPTRFGAVVADDGSLIFDYPTQQRAYCRSKLIGQPVDVLIAPAGLMKSRLQECGFHAMITPWARQEGHRLDDLKRDLLGAIFGHIEHVNPITGEVVQVLAQPHTSKLSRAKYSELIERTLEIAAECGVLLEAPNEYRQRMAKKGRAA